MFYKMKKSDLVNGAVVKLRNGRNYIKFEGRLYYIFNFEKSLNLLFYNEDLTYSEYVKHDLDVMKVNNEVEE